MAPGEGPCPRLDTLAETEAAIAEAAMLLAATPPRQAGSTAQMPPSASSVST